MDATEIPLFIGGRLRLDVPSPGKVTSPTVTLLSPNGATLVASQAATQWAGGVLSAGAAAKAKTLVLHSGESTGLTQGARLLVVTLGAREWVRVRSISGATLTLYESLQFAYPEDATVHSGSLSVAVSAAQAATLGEGYSARWAYKVDLEDKLTLTWWDVTRCVWDEVLSTAEFRSMAGGLGIRSLAQADAEGRDFADEIAQALERVRADIREKQLRPGLFRSALPFKRAIFERALLTWAESATHIPANYQNQPDAWVDLRRTCYGQALSASLNNAPYDADESGVVTDTERKARLGSVRIIL
jgi:hypothetical protein